MTIESGLSVKLSSAQSTMNVSESRYARSKHLIKGSFYTIVIVCWKSGTTLLSSGVLNLRRN